MVVSWVASLSAVMQSIIIAIARHGDKVFLLVATGSLLVLVFRQTNYRGHLLHTLRQVLMVALGTVVAWVCVVFAKEILSIPRPFEAGIVPVLWQAAGHAFPSGHAAILLMMALAIQKLVSKRIGFILIALAIIVPLFRFAIGIHSIVDIVGGWIIGYLFAEIIQREE
jgi:membrane-associated phospholipid phosphatase